MEVWSVSEVKTAYQVGFDKHSGACTEESPLSLTWSTQSDLAMANYVGNKFGQQDVDKLKEFEKRADPNDRGAQALLEEMRQHVKKLEDMRKNEDPRLSFSTPEFKEAQRIFTDAFKKNFGKPVEWALVKDHSWSTPQLRKLEKPVDVEGKPWPLDASGNPILK